MLWRTAYCDTELSEERLDVCNLHWSLRDEKKEIIVRYVAKVPLAVDVYRPLDTYLYTGTAFEFLLSLPSLEGCIGERPIFSVQSNCCTLSESLCFQDATVDLTLSHACDS